MCDLDGELWCVFREGFSGGDDGLEKIVEVGLFLFLGE